MKFTSKWIFRIALAVQLAGVLLVPALVAAQDAPRGLWMAEWLRPQATARTLGVLTLRDGKLAFAEQVGDQKWEVELAAVKRVASTNGGKALLVVTAAGDEYVMAIMQPNLTAQSPKKALTTLERALQLLAANNR